MKPVFSYRLKNVCLIGFVREKDRLISVNVLKVMS